MLLVIGAALGCGAQAPYVWVQELPPANSLASSNETIERGDLISVRVFGQDTISARGRVRPDGALPLSLVGDVVAAGKTPSELAKDIEEKLRPFVTSPNVTVTIDESQVHVDVIGEVNRKGSLALERPAGLLAALANAGGLTDFASHSRIFVLRTDTTGRPLRVRFRYESLTRGDPISTSFRLRSGDTIVVE